MFFSIGLCPPTTPVNTANEHLDLNNPVYRTMNKDANLMLPTSIPKELEDNTNEQLPLLISLTSRNYLHILVNIKKQFE